LLLRVIYCTSKYISDHKKKKKKKKNKTHKKKKKEEKNERREQRKMKTTMTQAKMMMTSSRQDLPRLVVANGASTIRRGLGVDCCCTITEKN